VKVSAGLLIYRQDPDSLKVLLVHPGGPHWRNRQDEGWGIPKGKLEEGEAPIDAAFRETREELGSDPDGKVTFDLGTVVQGKRKRVYCWAFEGEAELPVKSNAVEVEWPPGSGKVIEAPEIEEGRWFTPEEARPVIIRAQFTFIERLMCMLSPHAVHEHKA